MVTIASADKSARTTMGHVASDEASRGEGKQGAAATDETMGRTRGDAASMDEAKRVVYRYKQGHDGDREREPLL